MSLRTTFFVVPFAAFLLGTLASPPENGIPEKSQPAPAQKPTLEKKPPAKVDLFGDPLPKGALARLGTVRFRHHDMILSLAVSPDEKIVATAGGWEFNASEFPIRLWDLDTDKEIRQLVGEPGPAGNIVFSPDGKLLASSMGSSHTGYFMEIRLWELATGKVLHVIKDHQVAMGGGGPWQGYGLAFSPDSKLLATAGADGKVRLWDVATKKELHCWSVIGAARSLAFSSDGKVLASGSGGKIKAWNVTMGGEIASFTTPSTPNWTQAAFVSKSRQVVAAEWNRTIRWIDLDTKKEIRKVPGTLLGFSPDGKRLACLNKNEIQLWDLVQGKQIRVLKAHGHSGLFPFDGELSTGALSRDGKKLMVADWSTVRILDMDTGKNLHPDAGHWTEVVFAGFSADGSQVISAGDKTARVWDGKTGKEIKTLTGHKFFITGASVTADRKTLATASWDGSIRLWDLDKFKEFRLLETKERGTRHLVSFSPNGKTLAANTAARNKPPILLWNWPTGKELLRFGKGGGEHGFGFTPDGKGIVNNSWVFALYDPASGKKLRDYNHLPLSGLVFTLDGRIVAGAGSSDPNDFKFLSDKERLSMATLGEIGSGTPIITLKGHQGMITSLCFSGDGKKLATGDWDGTVRLWNVASGKELACLSGHKGGVTALAISADSKRLVSGGSDSTLLIWDVSNLSPTAPAPAPPLTAKELDNLWTKMLTEDAAIVYPALWQLVAARDQTVMFLQQQIPSTQQAEKQIKQWLKDLDSDNFVFREKAARELKALGSWVRPILQNALKNPASLETQQRVKKILAELPAAPKGEFAGQELRWVRAVQILEYIGSAEAVKLLETLAAEKTPTLLRQQAKMAVQRLAKQKH